MSDSLKPTAISYESIDLDKLGMIFRKHSTWLVLIFLASNLSAYIYLRYTKNVYESSSELKLDIKQDASELGIKAIVEDQNQNIIYGEIEQIRSKFFFERLIDSMNLGVSYYMEGKVLSEELYGRSPVRVTFANARALQDKPIYLSFEAPNRFTIRLENERQIEGVFEKPFTLQGATLTLFKTPQYDYNHEGKYYFVINSRESLLAYLQKHTTVEPLNFNANTIRISFKDYDARKAHDIVRTIDSVYLQYSYQQKNQANTQKINWLNNELGTLESKMEDFENYFETFTIENKSSDLNQELKKTIAAIFQVDSQRFYMSRRIAEINQLSDRLTTNNFTLAYSQRQLLPEYISKKFDDVQRLQQEQEKLALSYNENTFAYRQKEKEYSQVRNEVFVQLAELKKDLLKNLGELNLRKEKLEKEFAALPDKSTQFAKNQRFYKLYEEFYLTMMQSKAQFEIAQAGSTPDFKILSSATLPRNPISPKRSLIFSIGFVAGIVAGFFFLGFLYIINDKITNAQEIERAVALPLLGVIPMSHHTTRTPFHILDNPKSMVSEAIRSLRTNLDFFTAGGNKKIIALSSTISGEGKSFLALNLGGVIALSKKKVVLLDLDMRKPKTRLPFHIPDSQKGVSTALISRFNILDCVVQTGLEYFDYVPAGPLPPNPSELLLNGDFSKVLTQLKEVYEFVIIDTPPVGLVTDGIMAMKKADVSIYVIRANYTKKEFLDNLKRTLQIHKLNNLSVVLNALPTSKKMYGYGYYEDHTAQKKNWRTLLRI